MRPRRSHIGASQKKDHFHRVVPLLRLLHTNKRRRHVSLSTLRLTAYSDTDLSRFVTLVIALYLSKFCTSYFSPSIASIVFRDPYSMQLSRLHLYFITSFVSRHNSGRIRVVYAHRGPLFSVVLPLHIAKVEQRLSAVIIVKVTV